MLHMDEDEDDFMKVWQLEAWVGQFPPPPPIPPNLKIPAAASGSTLDNSNDRDLWDAELCNNLCTWAIPKQKATTSETSLDTQRWIYIMIGTIILTMIVTTVVVIRIQKYCRKYREHNSRMNSMSRGRNATGESNNVIESESIGERDREKICPLSPAQNLYTKRTHGRPAQFLNKEDSNASSSIYSESTYETIGLQSFPSININTSATVHSDSEIN